MQRPKYTRLDKLMSGFHITGRQLAELMNVDYSLVSKWRNGRRAIGRSHIQRIAAALTAMDAPNRYARLTQITGYQSPGNAPADEQSIRTYLETWLQSGDEDDPADDLRRLVSSRAKASEIYVFHGAEGKREAVDIFLDYALEDTDQKIWLFSQEDPDWLSGEQEYLENWQRKNDRIARQNNTIQVIHPVSKNYKQVADYMLRWIPILMRERVSARYIPQYQDPLCQLAIYLNEDKAALISVFVREQTRKLLTCLVSDRDVLKNIKDVILTQFQPSREMFRRFECAGDEPSRRCLSDLMAIDDAMACLVSEPPVWMIREDIWNACIADSKMQAEQKERCISVARRHCYESLERDNRQTDLYCALHVPFVERMLTRERVLLGAFSRLTGFPVWISRDAYCRLLAGAAETIRENNRIHTAAVTESPLGPYDGIDIYAWRRGGACLISTGDFVDKRCTAMLAEEPTVALALYYRCINLTRAVIEKQAHPYALAQWLQRTAEASMR